MDGSQQFLATNFCARHLSTISSANVIAIHMDGASFIEIHKCKRIDNDEFTRNDERIRVVLSRVNINKQTAAFQVFSF